VRTLDRIDRAICEALANDARLSNKELAGRVGLAPSSCLERTRRLVEDGVLRAFRAEVDPAALGFGIEAMVAIRLRQHTRVDFESFRAYALRLPEAIAVYHMSGANDFLIHVMARDAHHLRDMAIDYFTTRPEVGHLETALIFEHRRGAAAV
jgi:DNA-binding Lrp family transcriptional regulator